MPGLDETKQFVPLKIAVLTISDSRSLKDDKSGALLVQRIVQASRFVVNGALVATAVFVGIVGFLVRRPGDALRPPAVGDSTAAVGGALVGPFAVPFELLGVLLQEIFANFLDAAPRIEHLLL